MSVEVMGLLREIRENLDQADERIKGRFIQVENSINDLFARAGRPGISTADHQTDITKSIEYRRTRLTLTVPRIEGGVEIDYRPSHDEIGDATTARKAIRNLFRRRDPNNLDPVERKSLSSFSLGSNQFILPSEQSDRVVSCLADPSDVAALMNRVQISAGSIRFMIDNARMQVAGWAC
jgi:hypothetical protein